MSPAAPRPVDVHALPAMLTALRLPSILRHWPTLAERADAEGWPAARFLAALAEIELADRDARRIQRHLQQSGLPGGKTLATLDFKALTSVPRARIEALAAGDRVETGANLIAIGNSGARPMPSVPSAMRWSRPASASSAPAPPTWCPSLQTARPDLALEVALARLDRFDLIILDDITCARKDQAESSVLFEPIARRHETRSLAIAANQPFSGQDRVFPGQAMTAAAIDRLVHHATILGMNGDSYRRRTAARRRSADAVVPPQTPGDDIGTEATDNINDKLREATAE